MPHSDSALYRMFVLPFHVAADNSRWQSGKQATRLIKHTYDGSVRCYDAAVRDSRAWQHGHTATYPNVITNLDPRARDLAVQLMEIFIEKVSIPADSAAFADP
ncbi:hypothetical protein QWY28_16175 [Nocardioides sp. SOB77]|uniref:Uncharacterized protein n=1 Tax=Nocardioides oceani TaxID=3058369 RepID=A0ABT8FIJ1_9ACTN|nr:hypothetical protein [Nocardioides oceani]MDN4174498.1 hypothetical protein [Nocardioides oceani]